MQPLVAIATPVYNGEKYLAETMECVQAQTYANVVHCVLDNASTDATQDIIQQFQDRRVPLIRRRNTTTLPILENWNAVLNLVPPNASYFRILSADDLIHPTYTAKMVAVGQQKSQAVAITCQEWLGDTLIGSDLPRDLTLFDGRDIVRRILWRKLTFPYDHCLYRMPASGLPSKFFATEFFGTILLCADKEAAMRVFSQGACAFVPEPLATTRWPGSVTSTHLLVNQVGIWSDLQLIERSKMIFGSNAEYHQCRLAHLRYYYLHLLWWMLRGRSDLVKLHSLWLRNASASPTLRDYIGSLVELPTILARRLGIGSKG